MPRPLHILNRVLRALLLVASVGLVVNRLFFTGDDDWLVIAAIVLAVTAVGLSPALWPALPAAPEKPAPAPQAPPQPAYQPPQQQQQYQPPQQAYQPQQGTTYGGHAQVPQQPPQQQQWPGHQQQ